MFISALNGICSICTLCARVCVHGNWIVTWFSVRLFRLMFGKHLNRYRFKRVPEQKMRAKEPLGISFPFHCFYTRFLENSSIFFWGPHPIRRKKMFSRFVVRFRIQSHVYGSSGVYGLVIIEHTWTHSQELIIDFLSVGRAHKICSVLLRCL